MRLIDADTLKEKWTIASPEPYSTDTAEVLDSIEAAHTIDAVPVVRCKDCKHYLGVCSFLGIRMNPSDFCSYGEQKEADHD